MYKHHLFSPSRMDWVGKEHKGCLFCKIAKNDPNVRSMVVHRRKDIIVVMNVFPYNTGHLQVFPVKHVEGLDGLSDSEISSLFVMVKKCTLLLRKVLNPKGFNVGINIGGDVSGASVEHLHVHIVPRFDRDFGFMEVTAETKVLPETLEQTFEKLKKEEAMLK
jgi:ATP adenylyltransferase